MWPQSARENQVGFRMEGCLSNIPLPWIFFPLPSPREASFVRVTRLLCPRLGSHSPLVWEPPSQGATEARGAGDSRGHQSAFPRGHEPSSPEGPGLPAALRCQRPPGVPRTPHCFLEKYRSGTLGSVATHAWSPGFQTDEWRQVVRLVTFPTQNDGWLCSSVWKIGSCSVEITDNRSPRSVRDKASKNYLKIH